ncbi:MAG: hypothetical protein E6J61_03510 [Deltaproteobacteria bacterium]|nr:MAG: hypothetical protein E6J61_03510 [Deltaproteobacteria bacterium]
MSGKIRSTAMALAIAFLGLLGSAGTASAASGAVKVAKSDKLGSYLTDSKGMTLYTFKKDTPGKSACAGDCVTKWPLFHAEKVSASGKVKKADFATITRDDGKKQTTYKGLPLYYFEGDKKKGDTKGDGVKDVWDVAKP